MADVLLLDVGDDDRRLLEGVVSRPGGPRVSTLRVGRRPEPSSDGRVVLVGAGEQLLSALQWVHAALPDARIAVLAPELEHGRIRRQIQFAPHVPLDLELLDTTTPDLAARVLELCAAVSREQRYESALATYAEVEDEEDAPTQVLLGALLEHAPIGVVVVDENHLVVGWNRGATTLLGCDQSTAGRHVGELFAAPAPVESLVTSAVSGPLAHEAMQVTVVGPDDRHLDVEGALSTTEDGRDVVVLLVQDAQRRLRVEAERDKYGAHVDMLVGLSESLLSAPDPDTALRQLGAELTMAFCDWVAFHAYDARGATARVVVEHRDPERDADVAEMTRLLPRSLTEDTPSRRIARGEGPVLLTEVTDGMRRRFAPDPEVQSTLVRLGAESSIAVPMAGRSGVLGSMVLFRGAGSRRFDDSDLKVGVEVGRRAGLVFEVLEANRRQRVLTEELQRSLLTDPPALDFAEIVARYQPAADEAQVGGDWYDSFIRADGTLMVTVGDVVGHDIRSAAAMGQVRGLLRGISYSDEGGPAEVVSLLDSAVQSLHPGITATAVVGRIEPHTEQPGAFRLCWTTAGHPAPVVLRAHGRAELLESACDLLLGVLPNTPRQQQETVLGPGDTVLLYSDGLVERRGQDLDEGIAALLDATRELVGAPLDVVCDSLLHRMLGTEQDDDVCLIALRIR